MGNEKTLTSKKVYLWIKINNFIWELINRTNCQETVSEWISLFIRLCDENKIYRRVS